MDQKEQYPISVIGMGPGEEDMMTGQALHALDCADVIVGYPVYLKLLGERYQNKRMLSTPMRGEEERCRMAFEEAAKGYRTALICSGDAGVYGMASLMYAVAREYPDIPVRILPGITAANSGAALLGAPLNNDYCVISLSDLLTPLQTIEMRLRAAAAGDFAIAIYNPGSHKRTDYLRRACDVLLESIEPDRPCGYVRNIGREGCEVRIMTLAELRDVKADMFMTVFIGSSNTVNLNGHLVTKRGYKV